MQVSFIFFIISENILDGYKAKRGNEGLLHIIDKQNIRNTPDIRNIH
jgi:hypothetical protein